MVSVKPQCRRKLHAEELNPYPQDLCLKCGWTGYEGDIENMCVESGYALYDQRQKEKVIPMEDHNNEKVQTAFEAVEEASARMDFEERLSGYVNEIIKHTGLQRTNPEHLALIQMYTILAIVAPEKVDESTIHDVWALWTMITRKNSSHENLIPFDKLDERTKVLDKTDMWAIKQAAEECK